MTSRVALVLVLAGCGSSSSSAPPTRAARPAPVRVDPAPPSSSAHAREPPEARTERFVGVWHVDAQAHFDKAGSDPDEKQLALVMARSHLELTFGADGRFALRSTEHASAGFTGRWQVQRADGDQVWLFIDRLDPPQKQPGGALRLVIRDADHLEYYKQIGEPPEDDHVVFFVRAQK